MLFPELCDNSCDKEFCERNFEKYSYDIILDSMASPSKWFSNPHQTTIQPSPPSEAREAA